MSISFSILYVIFCCWIVTLSSFIYSIRMNVNFIQSNSPRLLYMPLVLLAKILLAWRPRPSCTLVLSGLVGRAWYKVWKVMFWSSESYNMNNSYSCYVKYWNKNGGLLAFLQKLFKHTCTCTWLYYINYNNLKLVINMFEYVTFFQRLILWTLFYLGSLHTLNTVTTVFHYVM